MITFIVIIPSDQTKFRFLSHETWKHKRVFLCNVRIISKFIMNYQYLNLNIFKIINCSNDFDWSIILVWRPGAMLPVERSQFRHKWLITGSKPTFRLKIRNGCGSRALPRCRDAGHCDWRWSLLAQIEPKCAPPLEHSFENISEIAGATLRLIHELMWLVADEWPIQR